MKIKISLWMVFAFLFLLGSNRIALANNLTISDVAIVNQDAVNDTVIVQFNIHWDNSWYSSTNHDAVWLFVKMKKAGTYYHAMMAAAGINPADTSPGSNTVLSGPLQIYVPADLTGAFIRPTATETTSVNSTNVRLKVKYSSSPLSAADTDSLVATVYGIEMVYIPTASFNAGDTSSTAWLRTGSAGTFWTVASEAAITVSNVASGGYYYKNAGQSYEYADAAAFTIFAAFPKGYAAFYAMKHEITEGQWVDFIQSLPAGSAARTNRDITSSTNGGKNSDSTVSRNTICQASSGCSGTYGDSTISSNRPDRAMSYLGWTDIAAYLDWAALRPMTELEFEKMARGTTTPPVSGEYAWGGITPTAGATISGTENGTETITTASANINYNSTTFTGGDASSGPLRAGIFATGTSTRVTSGAGFYGNMDLSGNLWDHVVSLGNSLGITFTGTHGDGVLVSVSGYEGNANVSLWPHTDVQDSTRGVTKADGTGFRGGSWSTTAANGFLKTSDRTHASNPSDARANDRGGRGVRTYDGP